MTQRTVPLALLVVVLPVALVAGCPHPRPARYLTTPTAVDHFVILGDVRLPSRLEFWARSTNRERAVLLRTVAETRPAFVAIHGDFVFNGSSKRHWARFDQDFAPLRWARIPILPALGNHEYLGRDQRALGNYFARFPELDRQRWYRRNLGALALIVLDTNRDNLGAKPWARQLQWLKAELRTIDADPRVKGVVVFGHDPPYTNSRFHGDDVVVKRDVVPIFMAARKTQLYVGGHVHSYERFRRHGKMFLTTGGGGAPIRALRSGKDLRHRDDLYRAGPLRPHHYVAVRLTPQGLELTTRGLERGARQLHLMERFALPWPAAAAAPSAAPAPATAPTPATPATTPAPATAPRP